MGVRLTRISIAGFKTIRDLSGLEPKNLNVLIGTNGAGKSNFISFFRFMQWMLSPPGQMQLHIRDSGGASAILHYGSQRTPQMTGHVVLETDAGTNEYEFRLFHVAGDTLAFAEERYRFIPNSLREEANWTTLPVGRPEAGLVQRAESGDKTAGVIRSLIRSCVVYQFHNTSRYGRLKQRWSTDDCFLLKEDGANLGPFLLRIRDHEPESYRGIVETIRLVFPLFADFELQDYGGSVLLQWRERGSDVYFSADQASDGLLRFFALTALLRQPTESLPDVLLIDEPELGLHPHALEVLAALIQKVAFDVQVIISTQSAALLNEFAPDDVVVVDRHDGESRFRRLGADELTAWLEDYTLGDLWRRNFVEGATNG
jgi:predicted ATPase